MNLPEVRIKYAWLLTENASVGLNELWGGGKPLLDHKDYRLIVDNYQGAWVSYEERILRGVCELMELEFRQNILDVYIAPWFRAFSDPMVIGVVYSPERFIEVLTHELIHRLLTDNIQTEYHTRYRERWVRLYGDGHSLGTLVHIPVHAVYQAVFDDIIHEPQRTKNDIEFVKKDEDYRRAWEYVQENDYRLIVEQLKKDYKELVA